LKFLNQRAPAVVLQTTLTVQQKTNFNRCAVAIEIYFMFMIFVYCSKSLHTVGLIHSLAL